MNFVHHTRPRRCPSSFIATTTVGRRLKSTSHEHPPPVTKNTSVSLSVRLSRRQIAALRAKSIHSGGKPPSAASNPIAADIVNQLPPQIEDLGMWKVPGPLRKKTRPPLPLPSPKKNGIRPTPKQIGAPNKSRRLEDKNPLKYGWKGEEWQEKWYTDDSGSPPWPGSTPSSSKVTIRELQSIAVHPEPPCDSPISPLPYTRRVEGIFPADNGPVLQDVTSPSDHRPIAKLSHGLDRVLFNPGIYWLKDPRSQVYNFSPWLESVPNVKDFAFERISTFIKSSRDEDLWTLAKREDRPFAGSTSSLTGILSQIYFLISDDKEVDTSNLSRHFMNEPKNFTPGQRMPASVLMNFKNGVYATDSDSDVPGSSEKNILSWLGTLLEKFFTVPEEEFTRLLRSTPDDLSQGTDTRRDAFRFSKSRKFVMRSQLDCQDSRLPGTGVFDIKTRAVLPIRLDLFNYEENSGYLIRTQHGLLESFEKEYYDLIRSAFLKYNFQARIGNMDGVFVAYHNTARVFGFQYISVDEMDEQLFGHASRGQPVFEKCIRLLEVIVEEITAMFPEESLRCTFETQENTREMSVFVEPVNRRKNDPKPIGQLNVTAASYSAGKQTSGKVAVSNAVDWTLHWTVSRSASSEEEIRRDFSACKERQTRAWNLPTGVSMDEMARRWPTINYSGSQPEKSDEDTHFVRANFRKASRGIQGLRALAKAGRNETERLALLSEGTKKVVLGVPEPVDVDVANSAVAVEEDSVVDPTALDGAPSVASVETATNQDLERFTEADASDGLPDAVDQAVVEDVRPTNRRLTEILAKMTIDLKRSAMKEEERLKKKKGDDGWQLFDKLLKPTSPELESNSPPQPEPTLTDSPSMAEPESTPDKDTEAVTPNSEAPIPKSPDEPTTTHSSDSEPSSSSP